MIKFYPVASVFGSQYLFDWTRKDNPLYHYDSLLVSYEVAKENSEYLKELKKQGFSILVDSGGFQVVQLGKHFEPEEVLHLQQLVGTSGFVLDVPLLGLADRGRTVSEEEVISKAEKTRDNIVKALPYLKEDFKWLAILQLYPSNMDLWWNIAIEDFKESFSGIGIAARSSDETGNYGWILSSLLALSYLREKYSGWVHILGVGMPLAMWVASYWQKYFDIISFDSTTPISAARYGAVYNSLTGNKIGHISTILKKDQSITNFCNCKVCSKAEQLGISMNLRNLSKVMVLHNLAYLVDYADQLTRASEFGTEFLDWMYPAAGEKFFGDLVTIVKAALEYSFDEFRKKLSNFLKKKDMFRDLVSRRNLVEKITKDAFSEQGISEEKQRRLW